MKKIFSRLIFLFILLFSAYLFGKNAIGNILLKGQGVCKKGVLTNETSRIKYQKSSLAYSITIGDKQYEGSSKEEDLSKAGDSICIVYLRYLPSINKPLHSFNTNEVNCNCN